MLDRILASRVRFLVALALVTIPLFALAQAVALPESVPMTGPTSWKELLWTGVLIPLLGLLFRELQQWLAARRIQAQTRKDSDQRAFVEDVLFRLVDAVGAPIYARVKGIIDRATDPTSPGGAEITSEEWDAIFQVAEQELRKALTPQTLDLVMKTIGMGAAARWIATFVVKRIFAVRTTAASQDVPTDNAIALYGGPPIADATRAAG